MVKTKQQKSRPKKQPRVKKQGKQENISQFRTQLNSLGLQIVQLTADGNCFFRALADQLEGNEEEHAKYRNMVVQYILKNQEMFEPFIEDDIPFDEYCQSMEKDGTWAGQMELQAASLVTHCNICIHQCLSPRWYIKNFDEHRARMIHLSYHDGEHYNSVRLKEDPCNSAAIPILIKADVEISASSQAKASVKSKERGNTVPGSVQLVMSGSGCECTEKVEKVLLEVDGDIDAAIEFLVAEQGAEEFLKRDDSVSCIMDSSHGDGEKVKNDQDTEEQKPKQKQDNSRLDEKISRNKDCPCGSRKKYKSCCGTRAGRPSRNLLINQTVDGRKGRKERKQSRKGGPSKSPVLSGHDGGSLDMGALCI